MPTPSVVLPLIAPGAQVVVRDEEWLVRAVQQTPADGKLVRVIGASELVRDQEATFFTELDDVQPLRPEDTTLVLDPTPGFRRSRLYLEALIRKTPLPAAETRLAVGHRQLLDQLEYQRHPVKAALEALRPRLLIADAVGLGKTLEVGMVLSELIRRGRGERILVVTPRHILEQFQHELWTRFAIPLVRLDSEGIQRVRQKIPATRNPFTYYKRVIISIDTLKNLQVPAQALPRRREPARVRLPRAQLRHNLIVAQGEELFCAQRRSRADPPFHLRLRWFAEPFNQLLVARDLVFGQGVAEASQLT